MSKGEGKKSELRVLVNIKSSMVPMATISPLEAEAGGLSQFYYNLRYCETQSQNIKSNSKKKNEEEEEGSVVKNMHCEDPSLVPYTHAE